MRQSLNSSNHKKTIEFTTRTGPKGEIIKKCPSIKALGNALKLKFHKAQTSYKNINFLFQLLTRVMWPTWHDIFWIRILTDLDVNVMIWSLKWNASHLVIGFSRSGFSHAGFVALSVMITWPWITRKWLKKLIFCNQNQQNVEIFVAFVDQQMLIFCWFV